ncbi:DUF475 domain-containing protein [soil metagenome]
MLLLKSFMGSILVTVAGLAIAFWLGFRDAGFSAGLSSLFLCGVLAVLEISLSFDNAVVNASVLNRMTELWRKRFLTWGILLAVFGMRLILPLVIVAVLAKLGPIDALMMAIRDPKEYATLMLSIHESVAAFGGTFLFLVGIGYFLDEEKDEHWLKWIERPLSKLGRLQSVTIVIALITVLILTIFVEPEKQMGFLISGVAGVVTFLLVDGLGALLGDSPGEGSHDAHRASLGMFLYLEVLDASFSFDGVIGAFALTQSLFLIAIGLGIGAMFVRSITIVLVERGTLSQFKYLEHGAFWAILSLALLMYIGVFHQIPEVITGLCGATVIGASVWSSVRSRKKHAA